MNKQYNIKQCTLYKKEQLHKRSSKNHMVLAMRQKDKRGLFFLLYFIPAILIIPLSHRI
jgi:hypothetical protein